MFNLFGNKEHKKAANIIGVEIHRQLFGALKVNEGVTNARLTSPFITGYLYGFIRFGFNMQGYQGEALAEKYIKHICDGVLPNRLHEIFQRKLTILESASKSEVEKFEKGVEVGVYDSGAFNDFTDFEANNMYKFLVKEKLDLK